MTWVDQREGQSLSFTLPTLPPGPTNRIAFASCSFWNTCNDIMDMQRALGDTHSMWSWCHTTSALFCLISFISSPHFLSIGLSCCSVFPNWVITAHRFLIFFLHYFLVFFRKDVMLRESTFMIASLQEVIQFQEGVQWWRHIFLIKSTWHMHVSVLSLFSISLQIDDSAISLARPLLAVVGFTVTSRDIIGVAKHFSEAVQCSL